MLETEKAPSYPHNILHLDTEECVLVVESTLQSNFFSLMCSLALMSLQITVFRDITHLWYLLNHHFWKRAFLGVGVGNRTRETVSHNLGWLQAFYLASDDHDLLILLPSSLSAGSKGLQQLTWWTGDFESTIAVSKTLSLLSFLHRHSHSHLCVL